HRYPVPRAYFPTRRSSDLVANISHRLGQSAMPDEIRERLETAKARPETVEAFARMTAHLEEHGIDLAATPFTLGAALSIDGADLDRKSTRLNSSHVKISYA